MIGLSGGYRSALIIGLQGIRARKMRTLLSMVSLFLGVLAVVVVATAAAMAERALLANVEYTQGVDGTRVMYLPADGKTTDSILSTLKQRPDAVGVANGGTAFIGEPGVSPVNPGAMTFEDTGMGMGGGYGPSGPGAMWCDQFGCYPMDQGQQQPPGQAVEFYLQAMSGDVRQFKPYRVDAGQWLDFTDEPSLAPRIVINKQMAKFFSAYQFPAELRLNGATANMTPRIIGVVDDAGWGPTAYVRADEIINWMPPGTGIFGSMGGSMEVLMTPTSFDTEQILRSKLIGLGIPEEQLQTQTINSREQAETSLLIMQLIFYTMAGMVLLIGVAGILNVGLATVGERIEEFALRRAVGTPRLLLAGIVLAETLLTGLFTASAAIGFAALVLKVIAPFAGGGGGYISFGTSDLTFPWQAAVAGVIAGLVAGILGGLIPAIRAARIPIATVMRA